MAQNPSPPQQFMSVTEVATTLGLSRMTVYRMCNDGTLEFIRTGHNGTTYRITRESFEQHTRPANPTATPVIPGQTEITA